MITRRAAMSDAEILFQWRNDPLTREMSRNMEPVLWNDHVAWLTASLDRPDRVLLIGESGGVPVGTIRFDRHDDHQEASWTCAPEHRGKGHMKRLAILGCSQINEPIIAEIKRSNLASENISEASGFKLIDQRDALGIWRRESIAA